MKAGPVPPVKMDLSTLKRLMQAYDFRPKKRMGQSFLVSASIAERMAAIFEDGKESLVEIGGGFGALTEALKGQPRSLFVLEPDPVLNRYLTEVFGGKPDIVIEKKDVRKISFRDYRKGPEGKIRVIGNLPYALTSPILIHLVNERAFIEEALVTVQKEVADRLKAKPRTKSYSPLSCLMQCFTEVAPQFRIPRNAFYPQPEVESEVVKLRFLEKPSVSPKDLDFMTRVIRTGFGKRRKILANALTDLGKEYPKEALFNTLYALGFSKNVRAEELTLEDFARLSDELLPFPAAH